MSPLRSTVSFNSYQFKALFDKMLEKYIGKIDYSEIEINRTSFIGRTVSFSSKKDKSMIKSIVFDKKTKKVIERFFKADHESTRDYDHFSIEEYAFKRTGSNNLKINPNYLYKYYGTFLESNGTPKEEVEISLQSPYHELFFAYAEIQDHVDFLEKNKFKKTANNETNQVVLAQKTAKFDAFYYSYFDFSTKKFKLDIALSGSDYIITMDSFHEDPRKNHTYSGKVELNGGKLLGTLDKVDTNSKDKVFIIINSGLNPFEEEEMLGSLMTVSAKTTKSIINLEFYLVDKKLNILNTDESYSILRYLLMHRYNFRIPNKPPKYLSIKARGTDVDYLEHMVGTYRVWRFDSNYEKIVQSILCIEDDYRVRCYTTVHKKKNFNNQICLLHQNFFHSNILCMSSHPKDGTGVLGYMMINLSAFGSNQELYSGTFVSISDVRNHTPINRTIVLKKESFKLLQKEDSNELDFTNEKLIKKLIAPIPLNKLKEIDDGLIDMKDLLENLEKGTSNYH